MTLIDTLSQQLKGDYNYDSSGEGICFSPRFEKSEVKGSSNAHFV